MLFSKCAKYIKLLTQQIIDHLPAGCVGLERKWKWLATEEEEDVYGFEICPTSHPYAIQTGQKCCSDISNLSDWSSDSCEGTTNENHRPCCTRCYDAGCHESITVKIHNLSPNYDEIYDKTANLEANRPIFTGLNAREGKCMWWYRPSRHWWIGQCEDIGQNAGFANIDEDVSCPSNCHLQDFLEFPLTCFKRLLT